MKVRDLLAQVYRDTAMDIESEIYLGHSDYIPTSRREAAMDAEIPVIPDIHKAVYEAVSKPGALDMSVWHTCETTHCRAGWVTTLAGEAGKRLETLVGTPAAALLIYFASDPAMPYTPDFYADKFRALEDMCVLAEGVGQ